MTIAIVGAGAIGSLFGGLLARSGQTVWLYNRSYVAHVQAIAKSGTLTLATADAELRVPVRAVTRVDEIDGPVDLMLIAVKAYDTANAIADAAGLVSEDTLALSLQNGVGTDRVIADHVPEDRILRGITAQAANITTPGVVRWAGSGPTILGWCDPDVARPDERAKPVVDAFSEAGLETEFAADIRPSIYEKLLVNAAINPLTAIFDVPNGRLVEDPLLRALLVDLARETHPIVASQGVSLSAAAAVDRVTTVCERTADNVSSMLQDVRRGKRTEIEHINGAVVRMGDDLDVPVPLNRLVTELIRRRRHPD